MTRLDPTAEKFAHFARTALAEPSGGFVTLAYCPLAGGVVSRAPVQAIAAAWGRGEEVYAYAAGEDARDELLGLLYKATGGKFPAARVVVVPLSEKKDPPKGRKASR